MCKSSVNSPCHLVGVFLFLQIAILAVSNHSTMPRKTKVLWTPFEGKKCTFSSLSEAAAALNMSYAALASKANRSNSNFILTNEHGKLEKCD